MPQSSPPRAPAPADPSEATAGAASASGGWPYRIGRSSRLEPTAWALLALAASSKRQDFGKVFTRGVEWLEAIQQPDGLLIEPGMPGPNYGWNGLALIATLRTTPRTSRLSDRLLAGLLEAKGLRLENAPGVLRQNNALQAWSWTEGTFSWVEPTAYCLLAVKKSGRNDELARSRIAEAEAVLLDRVCEPGGWNYGNSQVLSQDLRPYVSTTALVLLALQDKRSHPVVQRALVWLVDNALSERSGMALSLSAVALRVFDQNVVPILRALREQQSRTGFLQNVHLGALAHYASTVGDHGARALTLQ